MTLPSRAEWTAQVITWNEGLEPAEQVEMEHVDECMIAIHSWRAAIALNYPPDVIDNYMARHNEFARRLPDDLLVILCDDDGI